MSGKPDTARKMATGLPEVAPGVPDNDIMNALRYGKVASRTRSPCPLHALPSARPPDAYLQNPARAGQKRPISQDRSPRTPAPRACLTIALACTLTGLTLAAHMTRDQPRTPLHSLPGSKRCPTMQLYQHLTATLNPASQESRRFSRRLSEQQRAATAQQRAAATAARSSSSEQQQQRAAAASSSSEQQ